MEINLANIHAEKTGYAELPETLSDMPFNSLTPILIETMHNKSMTITPIELIREAENKSQFFGISSISQDLLCQFQQIYFQVKPKEFECVQLSPIVPFGTCVALTNLGQNERLSTIRKSEVISDSTLALALQTAIRRKQQQTDIDGIYNDVNLATFHRLLRLQKFDPEKKWSQHFEILGTITSGRRKGKNSFRNDTIRAHIQMWINFFERLNQYEYCFNNIVFTFSSIRLIEWILDFFKISREEVNQNSLNGKYNHFEEYKVSIPKRIESVCKIKELLLSDPKGENIFKQILRFEQEVLEPLREANPKVQFCYEMDRKLGLGYFDEFCFHGFATNYRNEQFDLIDGGSSKWVGKMLSDRNEITVSSSFGVEIGITQFRYHE